jgi:outer membrane porin, OprD family
MTMGRCDLESCGWRNGTSGVGLALAVSLLAWCGVASAAGGLSKGDGSTYGPIEDELIVNNPPIPQHIGPRLLRDNIPGVADQMRRWPSFFGDLELDLHLRSYYFNRELPIRPRPPTGPDTVIQEAWALGGWLDFQSGWLLDTFRMGATGYTSQPAYAPDDRDGTGLLGPGQSGIGVLGQAFAQLRYENYALLTGYRQLVNQGFVNPQDNRMIPNTFEGATLTGEFGAVEYYLGYLTAMKRRNADTFDNMAEVAGVTTDQNRGLLLTSLNFTAAKGPASFAPLKGLEVYLGNYYVPDVFNTLYLNPEYRHDFTDEWHLQFGLQYFDQRSVGGDLIGDFSTWQVGARTEVGWRGLAFLAMMSATGADAGIRSPYGAWPGYISLLETDFNLANEKAWEVGVTFDWGKSTFEAVKVPGLWMSLLYAEGFDIKAQAQEVPVGKRREADLFTVWRPPQLPGFRFRFLSSFIHQEGNSQLFYDFRVILDIDLPLL